MRASLYTALIALTLLSWTAPARAHHVVSESGIAWVEPVSVFQVDVQTARFDLGGSWRGQWSTLTPSLEWRLHERFSLMGRLPVAMISLDDGRAVAGLADAELAVKYLIWASTHGGVILSAGAGLELPTGSAQDALGAGHFELSPFLALSTQPWSRLILNTLISERVSLEGDEPSPSHTGSPLAVHAAHELLVRQSVAWLEGPVYGTVGVDKIFVWSRDEPAGPLSARAELGFAQSGAWRASLAASLPLAGQARQQWSSTLSLAWIF